VADSGRLSIVVYSLAKRQEDGSILIGAKAIEGMKLYAPWWGGGPSKLEILVRDAGAEKVPDMDAAPVRASELPFSIRLLEGTLEGQVAQLRESGVVAMGIEDEMLPLARALTKAGVPVVLVSEYNKKSLIQMAGFSSGNPLVRARRMWWVSGYEQRVRRAIQAARGLQANGTPTYEDYKDLSRNAMLYFDSRTTRDLLVSEEVMARRIAELRKGGALRLAFSGRLAALKGADHLPRVGAELRKMGVAFTMDICGAGELAEGVAAESKRLGVSDAVRMRGVLDYRTGLVPFISSSVDLFVCCHRQGDPSCTYLETFACGVPIVGYDNDALAGLTRVTAARACCWATPLNDVGELARAIRDLNADREKIAAAGVNARAFAAENLAEPTFQRRAEHLKACARV
jgi:colanic acid/amylovoran biosynthesis glycosyltransferase